MNKKHFNMVTLSGDVIAVRRYADRKVAKLVLTVSSNEGCYYIEFAPAQVAPEIKKGDQVYISGHLFTTRKNGIHTPKIRAVSIVVSEHSE